MSDMQDQTVKNYRIDHTKGKGGSIVITDDQGRIVSVIVTEEAMANQSRALLEPIVDGLIYPGSVGLVAAPPKAGKTNLAFMLAHELVAGRDYLGYSVKSKCCALIAEFEEGDTVMAKRYQRFPDDADFFASGELGIQYTPAPFEFKEDAAGAITVNEDAGLGLQIKVWHEVVNKGQFPDRPGVVFIDTMARALPTMGGGKYTADLNYIGAVHKLAEKLGIAIVFIHHTNKTEHDDAADNISGTNGVAGSCDWMMVVFRDNDKKTKQRLMTGRLVCNSRYMSEDELLRWVKLSDRGFWELDFEKEDAEAMKKRVARENSIPRVVRKVVTLMRHNDKWSGSATDLVAALKDKDTSPIAMTRYLNRNQEWLAEQGIRYWNDRITSKRILHFEVVAAPKEQAPVIDTEDEAEPAAVESAEPETPSVEPEKWVPVDSPETFNGVPVVHTRLEASEPVEDEPLPEGYDPDERTVVMNITARVGEAEADEYAEAVHVLRDVCASQDDKVKAKLTVSRVHRALGEAGLEVPTIADATAGRWPASLTGEIGDGEAPRKKRVRGRKHKHGHNE